MNLKIKTIYILAALAAMLLIPACATLPAAGAGSTPTLAPVMTPEVGIGNPGVSSGFPTGLPTDCATTAGPTQSTDCSGTVVVPTQPDGSLTLTLNNKDQTLILPVGGTFLLNLGEVYIWTITIADPSIISRVPNIAVIKGAQGIYLAHKVGQTVLTAVGDPACRQSKPACGMPSIIVQFNIEVK